MAVEESRSAGGVSVRPWDVFARGRVTVDAVEHLAGGLASAVLAAMTLVFVAVVAVLCLVGVGLPLAPAALRGVRAAADRERARLSAWGPEVLGPAALPERLRDAARDTGVRRELRWLLCHATSGLLLGLMGLTLPLATVRDATFPLWWRLVPPEDASSQLGLWLVHDTAGALGVGLIGIGWLVATASLTPGLAWLQAWPGRRLLAPDAGTDLALRVATLSATRAAALDAHAAELRRIERALHDGTQNRIVGVTVLVGAARRAVARDPATADAILERAQTAAEEALSELRVVVRSILPPVLADRSLVDALSAITADCAVPCVVDADVPGRCAASVESTAYFAVAESLTNVARHSRATRTTVTLRREGDRLLVGVTDDGRGGAVEVAGSGLAGIRRRVEALDGTFALASPPGGPTTLEVSLPCGS